MEKETFYYDSRNSAIFGWISMSSILFDGLGGEGVEKRTTPPFPNTIGCFTAWGRESRTRRKLSRRH